MMDAVYHYIIIIHKRIHGTGSFFFGGGGGGEHTSFACFARIMHESTLETPRALKSYFSVCVCVCVGGYSRNMVNGGARL